MGENTKIEWCHHTFSPWYGCQNVGPGCDHRYAEGWAKRSGLVQWGPGKDRRRSSPASWRKPLRWNRQAQIKIDAWEKFKETQPGLTDDDLIAQGFVKPERPRVFCASLGDVFDNAVPSSWRADLFELIEKTPHLDWLLVTKRIGNVGTMLRDTLGDIMRSERGWPWPNVWLGITVCNQAEADRDIPKLLAVPARVRFLSMEPLLGPVDLDQACDIAEDQICAGTWDTMADPQRCAAALRHGSVALLDWIIAGGESGPKARPSHPDWFRLLRDQCEAAGVPFLFKQWGEWLPTGGDDGWYRDHPVSLPLRAWNGTGWTDDGACGGEWMARVGTRASGRLLDGVLHDGYPEAQP